MNTPQVSILIPHYKTKELTSLCLNLLKHYTPLSQVELIVVDNYSEDESTEYLRTLPWITLLEREKVEEDGPTAHAKAMQLGLEVASCPYILSIHTDTLVKRHDWLDFLLQCIEQRPEIAAVGSWKLEQKNLWQRFCKKIEAAWQKRYYRFINKTNHRLAGVGNNHYYFRSHCAMYKHELLEKYKLSFYDDEPVGKTIHLQLQQHGHELPFLSSEQLGRYVDHINHATGILQRHQNAPLSRSMRKQAKRLQQYLNKYSHSRPH